MTENRLILSDNQKLALNNLKAQLLKSDLHIADIIIFGSVARGEAEEGSDLDILALTKKPASHRKKHDIYALVTDINLQYDTNLSILIIDELNWDEGIYSVLAIKDEVQRDGVRLN